MIQTAERELLEIVLALISPSCLTRRLNCRKQSATRIPMIAMTTSSSTRVKAVLREPRLRLAAIFISRSSRLFLFATTSPLREELHPSLSGNRSVDKLFVAASKGEQRSRPSLSLCGFAV